MYSSAMGTEKVHPRTDWLHVFLCLLASWFEVAKVCIIKLSKLQMVARYNLITRKKWYLLFLTWIVPYIAEKKP